MAVTINNDGKVYRNLDVDQTEDEIKASAGVVHSGRAYNSNASARYLKFYNATAANVTVGTTTPYMTLGLPGASSTPIPGGWRFSTALTVAATTGIADADTGAPGANEVSINLSYD